MCIWAANLTLCPQAENQMTGQDIPGQEGLKTVFRQMIAEDRVPHALLIHGVEGGLGLPLALLLSQSLLCENLQNGEPCGQCANCTKTKGHTHPDLHYIVPVNGNKSVKKLEDRHTDSFMADWREALIEDPYMSLIRWYQKIDIENKQGFIGDAESTALRKKLALRAFEGGYRIFIIWHADKMNTSFANKILKNLEEPSNRTIFILISENPTKLLPTIISRVQIFQEEHLNEEELAAFLERKFELDEVEAHNIAFRAEGNIAEAMKEVHHQKDPWLDEFKSWMRMAYSRDLAGLYKWSEQMGRRSRDAQKQFCNASLKVLDRCYRMGWLKMNIPHEGEDAKFFKDFSPFINTANIEGFMVLIEEASFHIERNVNEKIVWFDSSIQAIRLVHAGKKSVATA